MTETAYTYINVLVFMENIIIMRLVKFQEKYRQAFIDFNTDWIVSNFGSLRNTIRKHLKRLMKNWNMER